MQTVHIKLTGLNTTETLYAIAGLPACRIIGAYAVVTTPIDTTNVLITISDDSDTVGVITIAHTTSADNDITQIAFNSTTEGKVEFNHSTPIKIVANGGAASTGACMLTLILDEFHADN